MLVAAAVSQMGATDCGNALRDPGFDLWCGDQMCAWKVERGEAHKVPTWNAGDPGVELVGSDVAIEQVSPVDSGDGACIEFDLIADVDESSQVALNIDVFGDGSVEHVQPIPTSAWTPLKFELPIQGSYRGIRFEITKRGTGHAVLAQIGAKIVDGCAAFSPIVPAPAPLGAPCDDTTGCADGTCQQTFFGGLCVGCTESSCAANQVCGASDPTSPLRELPRVCEPTGSRELGEQCLHDGECGSGICNFGFAQPTLEPGGEYGNCSACRAGDACGCGAAWTGGDLHGPFVCGAALHAGVPGSGCGDAADCASGACQGTARLQCDVDGRACATAADCPFDGLHNTPCSTVGIQGGSCE
ncbi:MAG: hypothetical protein ABI467_14770 [Kofleriaceae bacterium]